MLDFLRREGEDMESFYPIRPKCQADVYKTWFKARVRKTLSQRRWNAAFTEDGHLDIAKVLRRIQRGGIHPSIKGEVWEFLLGCYDPNSTYEERNKLRQKKKSEINQARLWAILAVYAWVDDDSGYVQGMNDICSPMIILFENDADAYWCFDHAMRRVRENFRCSTTSIGLQLQLGVLAQVIKTIDLQLHQDTSPGILLVWVNYKILPEEDLDGGQYLFALRMLMVLFCREFSFVDAMYIWEIQLIWAMEYNPNIFALYENPEGANNKEAGPVGNKLLKQYGKFGRKNVQAGTHDQEYAFAVYVVASVLETKNKQLLSKAQGLDDVVKILGDTT